MEWSSDDEDVPPTVSLHFSGTAASPCFLVQNSQPSPNKQIPSSCGGGFLNGLSQLNRGIVAERNHADQGNPLSSEASSDGSKAGSEKTVCSSGASLPRPVDRRGEEGNKSGVPAAKEARVIDEEEDKENAAATNTAGNVLNRSEEDSIDNVIPSSIDEDDDSFLRSSQGEEKGATGSRNETKAAVVDAIDAENGGGSSDLESSPGAHLVSDATTAVAASSSSPPSTSLEEKSELPRRGRLLVTKARLEEMKRASASASASNENSPNLEVAAEGAVEASSKKGSEESLDVVSATPSLMVPAEEAPAPPTDKIASHISLSPSYDRTETEEDDDDDVIMPTPGALSQDGVEETEMAISPREKPPLGSETALTLSDDKDSVEAPSRSVAPTFQRPEKTRVSSQTMSVDETNANRSAADGDDDEFIERENDEPASVRRVVVAVDDAYEMRTHQLSPSQSFRVDKEISEDRNAPQTETDETPRQQRRREAIDRNDDVAPRMSKVTKESEDLFDSVPQLTASNKEKNIQSASPVWRILPSRSAFSQEASLTSIMRSSQREDAGKSVRTRPASAPPDDRGVNEKASDGNARQRSESPDIATQTHVEDTPIITAATNDENVVGSNPHLAEVAAEGKEKRLTTPSTFDAHSAQGDTVAEDTTEMMDAEESQHTMELNRSVTTHLKRRRREIDYKVLSQRGKNRESNAFALLESRLRNTAAKTMATTPATKPRKPPGVDVKSGEDGDMKRKDNRRQTMIVRMAQKKITAARRMEMIRRRSSVMREGGFIPSPRNVTTASEEDGERMSTVREASECARVGNNSSRASAHSRQNSAGNTSLPALSNSSLGRYRLASSTPNEPERPRSIHRGSSSRAGDASSQPIDEALTTPKRGRTFPHVRTPHTAPPSMTDTPTRRTKRQRSGNEDSDDATRKRRNLQDRPRPLVDAPSRPPEDLEGVVIHQTKRVEVTEKWIRAADMKVLKTKFTTWEEGGGDAPRDDDHNEANAPTASLPREMEIASTNLQNVDTGSRPYAGDVSSPSAGGSSSRSSRDSLFKPKRPEGTAHRDLGLAPGVLKPVHALDGETSTSTSEPSVRTNVSVDSVRPQLHPMEPPKQTFPARSNSSSSGRQTTLRKSFQDIGVQTEYVEAETHRLTTNMSQALRIAGVVESTNDAASPSVAGKRPKGHVSTMKSPSRSSVLVDASSTADGESTNTIPPTEDSAGAVIPETSDISDGGGGRHKVAVKPRTARSCVRVCRFEDAKTAGGGNVNNSKNANNPLDDDDDDDDDDDIEEVEIDDESIVEEPVGTEEMFMMEDDEAVIDEPAVGSLVLAKWSGDGFFYPGKITSVERPLTDATDLPYARFLIRFDDGDQRSVRGADVIFRKMLPIGFHVMASVESLGGSQTQDVVGEPEFEPAIVLGHIRRKTKRSVIFGYVVEKVSNGASAQVPRAAVILTSQQAAPLLSPGAVTIGDAPPLEGVSGKGISLDNVLSGKRRRLTTSTPSTPAAEKGKEKTAKERASGAPTDSPASPTSAAKRANPVRTPATPKGTSAKRGATTPTTTTPKRVRNVSGTAPSSTTPSRGAAKSSKKSPAAKNTARGPRFTPLKQLDGDSSRASRPSSKSSSSSAPRTPAATISETTVEKTTRPSETGTSGDEKRSKLSKEVDTTASLDESSTSSSMPSSPIFKSLVFILTHGEKTRVKKRSPSAGNEADVAASASESEAEDRLLIEVKFVKGMLTRQIVNGGGVVSNQTESARFDELDKTSTFCIANTFCRTAKYVNALAFDIPCVSHVWIIDSCRQNSLLDHRKYLLPRGLSIESETVIEQPIGKATSGVFKERKFLLCSKERSFEVTWSPVLRGAGASRVVSIDADTTLPAETLLSVDAIITDETSGGAVVSRAVNAGVPIVSTEWVIQSLVTGRCANPRGHARYAWDYTDK